MTRVDLYAELAAAHDYVDALERDGLWEDDE